MVNTIEVLIEHISNQPSSFLNILFLLELRLAACTSFWPQPSALKGQEYVYVVDDDDEEQRQETQKEQREDTQEEKREDTQKQDATH